MEFPILLERVQSEFNEMPGLRLTPAQAARLLGLQLPACLEILQTLVRSSFLRWTPDGSIVRADP